MTMQARPTGRPGGKLMENSTEGLHGEYRRDPHLEEAHRHMRAARQAMRKSWESLFPAGFVENRRAARREVLLAMRSMIDSAIDRSKEGDES
jgi:hypothetical protein